MACLLNETSSASQKAVNTHSAELDYLDNDPSPDLPSNLLVNQPEAETGSSIATLWLKVNQDNQPPASIPSTLMPLITCPQCNQVLALPLKPSNQQACVKCGWSNRPHNLGSKLPDEPTEKDLLCLLEQAASESLENMKPRKKQN